MAQSKNYEAERLQSENATSIFVFGPHIGSFTKQAMNGLVQSISRSSHREWILKATSTLPNYWDSLAHKLPEIATAVDGQGHIKNFDSWLRNGHTEMAEDADLPNIIITPLVVLIQLTQYWEYLALMQHDDSKDLQAALFRQTPESQTKQRYETLGFCGGMLGAVAVASAHDASDFEKYGSVAVRLAMLLGALVDARNVWDTAKGKGETVSLAVAWVNAKQGRDVSDIIDDTPDTHLAVKFDTTRATVITTEKRALLLTKRLRADAGAIVHDLGMRAHIHSPDPVWKVYTDMIVEICDSMPGLQYASATDMALQTYNNRADRSTFSTDDNVTEMIVRGIMVHQCDWYGTFSAVIQGRKPFLATFGLEKCVPPSLMRTVTNRQFYFPEDSLHIQPKVRREMQNMTVAPRHPAVQAEPKTTAQPTLGDKSVNVDSSVAVVGMSIKTAGADDLLEFSDMLKTGQSQHELIHKDRFPFDILYRENPEGQRDWYGCFVRNPDAFDHKFFKKSPRESAAMDPQGRITLETAYQAVEQSGYFTIHPQEKHIGVFHGSAAVEYDQNAFSHEPSAFTATGHLKSFISGRVSHHFGWTGPSMTFDTACSSSMVAIHSACRSLLAGDCAGALAGGSSIITNMLWHHDMAAGGFLSPTGQCKPFDDNADGYCRAEGFGFVFLKRLSDARRDGNPIFATIPASAVYQNQNSTPLFVPNAPSLSRLFADVLRKANIPAKDISLVEAHGTGTSVGDPAEYESIRATLGGVASGRETPLAFGSVKGSVGHAEGASGVLSLIKVIVMMQQGFIPPQASHKIMNHNIDARPDDRMELVTTLREWKDDSKVALINNYGACGSNASLIVVAPTHLSSETSKDISEDHRLPFRISGLDSRAIKAYSAKMVSYLTSSPGKNSKLADLCFNLNRSSNNHLPTSLIFTCRSTEELVEKFHLASGALEGDQSSNHDIISSKSERPVIFCFGGQNSRQIGLDRMLYENISIFREHLDAVEKVVESLGLQSIFPDIFSTQPCKDPVKLQLMLFAVQYACAKSWQSCGLEGKVAAVVGHSFGEITALCIAEALSLKDTVELIASRAGLVRDAWGLDPGAMIAIEADKSVVEHLAQLANGSPQSNGSVGIACYNGPASFTLAGTTSDIIVLERTIRIENPQIKYKRLNVTNAFHSKLVEKLIDGLGLIGKSLEFHDPTIPIERATKQEHSGKFDWSFVPSHMHQPVFFDHAVQRLSNRFPQAIFLEAGSNSTITAMAARALSQHSKDQHFQGVSLTNCKSALEGLANATVALWKQGLHVSFWAHHAIQAFEYGTTILPPYQFDKSSESRHWLPVKSPSEEIEKRVAKVLMERNNSVRTNTSSKTEVKEIWDFVGFQDRDKKHARFHINCDSEKYKELVSAHVVAETAPICPATLLFDMIIETLSSLHPEWLPQKIYPTIRDMINHSPICFDPTRAFYLDLLEQIEETGWKAQYISRDNASGKVETHADAIIQVYSTSNRRYLKEFSQFERLVSYNRTRELLDSHLDDENVEIIQGRQLYKAFGHVVDYSAIYRGVRFVVGRKDECAGHVQLNTKHRRSNTWLDVPLSDSFAQIGGIWANLLSSNSSASSNHIYIAKGVDLLMRSPSHTTSARAATDVWHVYARHTLSGEKSYISDMFIFDPKTEKLVEVMLGVHWGRVAKTSMSKMLQMRTSDESALRQMSSAKDSIARKIILSNSSDISTGKSKKRVNLQPQAISADAVPRRDLTAEVRDIVARVTGLRPEELELDAEITDLGIDSLMGMEIGREVENVFVCSLDQAEQANANTLRKLVACIEKAVFEQNPTHMADEISMAERKSRLEHTSAQVARPDVVQDVLNVVAMITGVDIAEIDLDTEVADYGIDSLMGVELGREVEKKFSCTLDQDEQSKANTIRKFILCVETAISATTHGGENSALNERNRGNKNMEKVERLDAGALSEDSWVDTGERELSSTGDWTPEKSSAVSTPQLPLLVTSHSRITLPPSDVLASFAGVKLQTDRVLQENHLYDFESRFLAESNRLCVSIAVEALEEMGCSLGAAAAGQVLKRVSLRDQHTHLGEWLYGFLERDARLIDIHGASGKITRTHIKGPRISSAAFLEDMTNPHTGIAVAHHLTHYVGMKMIHVLTEKSSANTVIDSSVEHGLVDSFHKEFALFRAAYVQIRDTVNDLTKRLPGDVKDEPLKLLEVDGGKGGLTAVLAHFLASLDRRIEYTFTDASARTVAETAARLKAQYPFIHFAQLDISNLASCTADQHIIVSRRNLGVDSLPKIRRMLVPNGFLLAINTAESMPFMRMISGVLEGENKGPQNALDQRKHSSITIERLDKDMHAAGFGHVDWTDGSMSTNAYCRVILAIASGPQGARLPKSPATQSPQDDPTLYTDKTEELIASYARGWASSRLLHANANRPSCDPSSNRGAVVLVTGATGSLGSHIVQKLAENTDVCQVVCINRDSVSQTDSQRQDEAFHQRGINLTPAARSKLRVLGTDISKPRLGLVPQEYNWLVEHGTHIIHNAWPMSWSRPLSGFAPQLQTMRNLLDLAHDMAISPFRDSGRVGFQFVSSIGVVGLCKEKRVAERRFPVTAAVPIGYAQAKWVCEALLDETLHKFPMLFRPHVTRPGQIAGSSVTGYWNTVEHLPFLIKSAQSLCAWPDLGGVMQWVPVDLSAAVMSDLVLNPNANDAVYHVDNPVGQPWKEMNSILTQNIITSTSTEILPFKEWVRRVRTSPLVPETENPAARPGMPDWLETNFERMACGGLVLDTKRAQTHSNTMKNDIGPVSAEVVAKFIEYWRQVGFLY